MDTNRILYLLFIQSGTLSLIFYISYIYYSYTKDNGIDNYSKLALKLSKATGFLALLFATGSFLNSINKIYHKNSNNVNVNVYDDTTIVNDTTNISDTTFVALTEPLHAEARLGSISIIGLVILLLGIFILIISAFYNADNEYLYIPIVIGVVLAVSGVGIQLFNVSFTLTELKFTGELAPSDSQHVQCVLRRTTGLRVDSLGRIGPFREGSVKKITPQFDSSLVEFKRELQEARADHRLRLLIVAGGADKQRLGPEARERYGSNLVLARARASAVRARLRRLVPKRVEIMPVIAGGRMYGTDVSGERLRKDRYVDVYALGTNPVISR